MVGYPADSRRDVGAAKRWSGSQTASDLPVPIRDGADEPPPLADFSTLDFSRLWDRRQLTSEVERAILAEALGDLRRVRLLELGTGEGRVSDIVQSRAETYVGVDLTPQFVARVPNAQNPRVRRIAGNIYRLPFSDSSFDGAVMIRTYNFLADPLAALSELARILAPGAVLVVSYNPRPSVGTVVDDIKSFLSSNGNGRAATADSQSSAGTLVYPSSFPAWAPARSTFLRMLRDSGFTLVSDLPCGLEDYLGFRSLPRQAFVALAHALGGAGLFPSRFVTARRNGIAVGALPPLEESWRCPRCRSSLAVESGSPLPCLSCGIPNLMEDGVLDARYHGPLARS